MSVDRNELDIFVSYAQADLDSLARIALEYAALLPPETVPWPWLDELATAHLPEPASSDAQRLWQAARSRLIDLRILTVGEYPEIARIHRLVAASVAGNNPARLPQSQLMAYVESRAWAMFYSQSAPAPWELEALIAVLPHLLASSETAANGLEDYRGLANATVFVSRKIVTYRGLSGAQSLLESAHSYHERLVASDPGNLAWQRDLSASYGMLGELAVKQGDLPGALQRFTETLSIAERLAASDPDNMQWQRDLWVSNSKLGNLAVAQGDLFSAKQRFIDCLTIANRLTASDPGNADLQRDLSLSYGKLGELAVELGDLPSALRHFTDELSIMERLAASDPGNAQWQRDLSVSHGKLGELAVTNGDLSGAFRRFTDGLIVLERLAASDPGNAKWQRDLAVSHHKLGELAVEEGDVEGAIRRFTDCLSIAERTAVANPDNAQRQRELWVLYGRLAEMVEQQDGEGALQYWRKAYSTLDDMKTRGIPISPEDEKSLVQLRVRIGA